jgi:hypothetical protein
VTIRVDGDAGSAVPPNGGDDWGARAFRYLQDALVESASLFGGGNDPLRVDIPVATTSLSNPYRPDRDGDHPGGTDDPNASFVIQPKVRILGGFDGSGDEARDAVGNPAVLSGVLGGGNRTRNILIATPSGPIEEEQLILDGFIVTGGLDGLAGGGGMQITGTDSVFYVARTRFTDNTGVQGGALEVRGSGGGSGPIVTPKPVIVSCRFDHNLAVVGGAFTNANAQSTVYSTLFHANHAFSPSPNQSLGNGGAIANAESSPSADPSDLRIVNCTFVDNLAESGLGSTRVGKGGGIYLKAGTVSITNSIFWGNRHNCPATNCTLSDPDPIARQQIHGLETTQFTAIEYSLVEDSTPGDGMLPFGGSNIFDVDPLFENPASDDFRIMVASIGIDAGDSAAIEDPLFVDQFGFGGIPSDNPIPELDGMPRKLDEDVDLGAYERLVGQCPADTNGDAQVDFEDLLTVLSAFGPCPSPCDADIVPDGVVDFNDLLTLLAAFGPCNSDAGSPPQGIADCIARIGLAEPEKLAACIEAMILTGTP